MGGGFLFVFDKIEVKFEWERGRGKVGLKYKAGGVVNTIFWRYLVILLLFLVIRLCGVDHQKNGLSVVSPEGLSVPP